MPHEVTDPDILRQFNEASPAQAPAAPAADDSIMGRIRDPNSRFRRDISDLGDVGRGVGQSIAGGVDRGVRFSEWLTNKAKPYVGSAAYALPVAGQVAAASEAFPQAKSELEQFASAPSTSPAQSFGYGAGEVGQVVATGGGGAVAKTLGTGAKFAGNLAVNEGIWHAAGMLAEHLGAPIWPIYTTMVALKESGIAGVKRAFTKGGEEVAESAVKGAARTAAEEEKPFKSPWGETPTTSTGPKMAQAAEDTSGAEARAAKEAERAAKEQEKTYRASMAQTGKATEAAAARASLTGKAAENAAARDAAYQALARGATEREAANAASAARKAWKAANPTTAGKVAKAVGKVAQKATNPTAVGAAHEELEQPTPPPKPKAEAPKPAAKPKPKEDWPEMPDFLRRNK